ncbi:hypothetical protein GQ53DRAFT_767323 [Thozetella sp. PMI_491]|nr:hypothetical protein GQ53DRAFT_767323 [Thozetella sp. PMI_491]
MIVSLAAFVDATALSPTLLLRSLAAVVGCWALYPALSLWLLRAPPSAFRAPLPVGAARGRTPEVDVGSGIEGASNAFAQDVYHAGHDSGRPLQSPSEGGI